MKEKKSLRTDYKINGNQKRKEKGIEKWYYTYDFENRLTKVEHFDGTQTTVLGEYYYDGDGKRIKKVEASQTTIYIYLGWNVIYEKEFSTMTETKYVFKADCGCHVGKVVGGTTYFLHVDHLGSVRQETDVSGNTVWASPAVYDPFGELRGGGPANNEEGHLYTGKLRDTSTGLYYYGARYYDAKVGRFITRDNWNGEIQRPQTKNSYIYVLNNPLKFVDYDGNDPSCPLCKPGENSGLPPLPVSHYLWGLVIAAIATPVLIAIAVGLPAIIYAAVVSNIKAFFAMLSGMGSIAWQHLSSGTQRLVSYVIFQASRAGTRLASYLEQSILKVTSHTKSIAQQAYDYIKFLDANPDWFGLATKQFAIEHMQELGEFVHWAYAYYEVEYNDETGEYEITGAYIQQWEPLENGTWAWRGKWIHIPGYD